MKKKLFFSILSCLIFTCYFSLNLNAQAIVCGEFTITPGNGTILIEGTSGTVYPKFEIVDQITWTPVEACTNCNDYTITGLADGLYQIKAFDVNWSPCVTDWFNVTNSGSSGTDADGDGVTVEDGDCNDSDPNLTTVGASCDDGNPNTTGDIVNGNCTCLGTTGSCTFTSLNVVESCDNKGTLTPNDDEYTIIINPQGTNLSSVYHVEKNSTNGTNILVADNVSYGTQTPVTFTYNETASMQIEVFDGNSTSSFTCATIFTSSNSDFVNNGCPCIDNDNDGVCVDDDCDDNDPALPTTPGSICNNGAGTIQADGCTCSTGGNNSTLWTERTAPTGIFTTSKTFVENILTAQKVIVQSDVYADYVFEKDYPLLPLPKLEQYIQKNHHLPNVPSAKEVIAKGIDVSEMSVKQMEKIEELTLYLLQINKRLEQLEKENKQLKKILKKRK